MSSEAQPRRVSPSFSRLSPSSPVSELGPVSGRRRGSLAGGWQQLTTAGLRTKGLEMALGSGTLVRVTEDKERLEISRREGKSQ